MAEAFFNQWARHSRAESAGMDPSSSIKPEVVVVMKERGLDVRAHVPRRLTPHLLSAAYNVIVMGGARFEVKGSHVAEWDVGCPYGRLDSYRQTRDELEKRVRALVKEVDH